MMNRNITLIVKITNACNMRCRYCFIEPDVYHKTMAWDTARRVIRSALDSEHFEDVHFVWHGGEPLLRGRPFFEAVLAEQGSRPTNVRYTNALQTNATLLDDELLQFFVDHGVHIGLSLDGPPALNDTVRLSKKGTAPSAHQVTLDAASRLREHGRAPGAIVVVNRTNVYQPAAVYREFNEHGIALQLNPLTKSGLASLEAGGAEAGGSDLGITAEEYGGFLIGLVDVWFDDPNPRIYIEPIRQHIARILGVPGALVNCHFMQSCHRNFLGIAPDGGIYPCGMFQGEQEFCYGNIHAMDPEQVSLTMLFGRIESRQKKVLTGCAKCAFFDLCYGGCMFHSLKNAELFDEKDYYCAGYKLYFEHLLRRISHDLATAPRKGAVAPDRLSPAAPQ